MCLYATKNNSVMIWFVLGSLAVITASAAGIAIRRKARAKGNSKRETSEDETFVCRFDPTKDSYRAKVEMDSKVDIRKNSESETFDKNGIKRCSEMVVIANDIETVKGYLSDIIEKRITMPDFPKRIRFEWTGLPDEFVLFSPKAGQVVKAKNLLEICKEDYGTPMFQVEFSGKNKVPEHGMTKLETPEEYESRLRTEKIKKEEDRCKKLLQQLEDVQGYDEARMKEEAQKEEKREKENMKKYKKDHSIERYGSVQAAIAANSGNSTIGWW